MPNLSVHQPTVSFLFPRLCVNYLDSERVWIERTVDHFRTVRRMFSVELAITYNLHHTTVISNSQAVHKKEGQHKAGPRVK